MNRPYPIHLIPEKRGWFHPPENLDADRRDPSPSIVLAEDDEALRAAFFRHLTSRGFHVRCAANGDEAWKLLCEAPCALVITDHEMPGLLGLELVRRMRSESLLQPVILMSGNLPWSSPDLCDLLSPGAAIEKPFSMHELIQIMCAMVTFGAGVGQTAPRFASA